MGHWERARAQVGSLLFMALALALAPLPARGVQSELNLADCPEAAEATAGLVEGFYDREGFADAALSYTGEVLGSFADTPPLGTLITEEVSLAHRAVLVTCEQAVYATTLTADGLGEDWYLYLEVEDDAWTIAALRTLALPGFYSYLLEDLEEDRWLEDLMDPPAGGERPELSSAEQIANMRLVTSTDAELKAYFAENQDGFATLVSAFNRSPAPQFIGSDGRVRAGAAPGDTLGANAATAEMAQRVRELNLRAISRELTNPGCVFLSLGGILDNEVGYLFAPPSCEKPEMTPSHYILIEPIAPSWYLYKTT
jgi:hypothetical protein